jgi:hypothetical protein
MLKLTFLVAFLNILIYKWCVPEYRCASISAVSVSVVYCSLDKESLKIKEINGS